MNRASLGHNYPLTSSRFSTTPGLSGKMQRNSFLDGAEADILRFWCWLYGVDVYGDVNGDWSGVGVVGNSCVGRGGREVGRRENNGGRRARNWSIVYVLV